MLLESLTLTALLALPQEPTQDPRMTSVLSDSELKSLSKKAAALMSAEIAYGRADANGTRRQRQKANADLQKAREKFKEEWERRDQKHDGLLAHMGDMVQMFDNCFEYEKPSRATLGAPQAMDDMATIVIPKKYRPTNAYPSVLVLPTVEAGKFIDARDYWESTWKASTVAEDVLLCMPELGDTPPAGGFDPADKLSLPDGQAAEDQRIRAVLLPFLGGMVQEYNVDRSRMVLDCGAGSSGFGLRLATYFPNRFAGLVLRDVPAMPEDFRLESLTGIPVLLVEHSGNAAHVKAVADKLNGFQQGSCTIAKSAAGAPFADVQGDIDAWVVAQRRNLFRSKVVIANNHDRFRNAYWVEMGTAEPLAGVPVEERPLLMVEADKATNRIVVTARNVENFTLYLNDALVDLGKEFTVEVNGKAFKETRARSLANMTLWCNEKFDPGFLFTATYSSSVPDNE